MATAFNKGRSTHSYTLRYHTHTQWCGRGFGTPEHIQCTSSALSLFVGADTLAGKQLRRFARMYSFSMTRVFLTVLRKVWFLYKPTLAGRKIVHVPIGSFFFDRAVYQQHVRRFLVLSSLFCNAGSLSRQVRRIFRSVLLAVFWGLPPSARSLSKAGARLNQWCTNTTFFPYGFHLFYLFNKFPGILHSLEHDTYSTGP